MHMYVRMYVQKVYPYNYYMLSVHTYVFMHGKYTVSMHILYMYI